MTAVLCKLAGALFWLYYLVILFYAGASTDVSFLWGLGGSILEADGFLLAWLARTGSAYAGLFLWIVRLEFLLMAVIVAWPLTGILLSMNADVRGRPEYLIVLGARIRDHGPTRSLKRRLDRAFAYAQAHPEVKVILSGGQGTDEVMSEAECMRGYLLERGLCEQRILTEEQSATTYENLKFCDRLYGTAGKHCGIVSSNYHIYRALRIARRMGYEHAEGMAAFTDPVMLLHYTVREVLAFWQGVFRKII